MANTPSLCALRTSLSAYDYATTRKSALTMGGQATLPQPHHKTFRAQKDYYHASRYESIEDILSIILGTHVSGFIYARWR